MWWTGRTSGEFSSLVLALSWFLQLIYCSLKQAVVSLPVVHKETFTFTWRLQAKSVQANTEAFTLVSFFNRNKKGWITGPVFCQWWEGFKHTIPWASFNLSKQQAWPHWGTCNQPDSCWSTMSIRKSTSVGGLCCFFLSGACSQWGVLGFYL